MNNLILSALVVFGVAVACFSEARRAQSIQTEAAELDRQAARWRSERTRIQSEENQLRSDEPNGTVPQNSSGVPLPVNSQGPDLPESWATLNPKTEGSWPLSKPYFYFPKTQIIGLKNLSGTGEVTATVFALSAKEKEEVAARYRQMWETLRAAQVSHAVPTNVPNLFADYTGEKHSVFAGPLTFAEIESSKERLIKSLVAALGEERGEMLGTILGEINDTNMFGHNYDRLFTWIRDGARTRVMISNGYSFTVAYDSENAQEPVPVEYAQFFTGLN